MKEILIAHSKKIKKSKILENIGVKKSLFFSLSIENLVSDEKLHQIIKFLNAIYKQYKKCIIISLHPRTKKGLKN